MTDTQLPEPLATIARMRADSTPEPDIAAHLGITKLRLWRVVTNWNRRHPARAVPRPASRPKVTRIEQTAQMTKAGKTAAEIADVLACSVRRVLDIQSDARSRGLLPRARRSPTATYAALQAKGAAPKKGHVADILAMLSQEQVRLLLARTTVHDTSLAHTIARVLTEVLDARKE